MLFPHMNTEDGGIFCGTGVLKFHNSRISPEPRENPQFSLADKASWEPFEFGNHDYVYKCGDDLPWRTASRRHPVMRGREEGWGALWAAPLVTRKTL